MDLRVWWPHRVPRPKPMGGQAMRKTLAVLVVALGLVGFYPTTAAVTVF
jgi:hypothetical protein